MEIQKGESGSPFIYLHGDYRGGGFYCYNLARFLGTEQPVYVLHPHGLFGPRMPSTIDEMVGEHLETLLAFQPGGPLPPRGPLPRGLSRLRVAAATEPGQGGGPAGTHLSPGTQAGGLLSTGPVSPRPTPARLNLQNLSADDRWRAVQWVYLRAVDVHRVRPYPGRLILLRPSDDLVETADSSLGWRQMAAAVETHMIPGGHLTSVTTYVQALAEHLKMHLRHASGIGAAQKVT